MARGKKADNLSVNGSGAQTLAAQMENFTQLIYDSHWAHFNRMPGDE
jgi:hypothetical protein